MNINEAIYSRRSIRQFNSSTIKKSDLLKVIEAGAMAPSGKNGQPWRFVIVQENRLLIDAIANLSIYKKWLKNANCFIIVLLDKLSAYHYIKDVQAIGACIQNILLSAHEIGIGSCWIGEIYKNGAYIKDLLNISDENLELMAIVALGYYDKSEAKFSRRKIEELLLYYM